MPQEDVSFDDFAVMVSDYRTKLHYDYDNRKRIKARRNDFLAQAQAISDKIDLYTQANKLLNAVSDSTLGSMIDTVTTAVNDVLAEMFKDSGVEYEVKIRKDIYRGRYAHMTLELCEDGKPRDLSLQSGDGIKQVISFLFITLLISVAGGRRLLIMDEVLNGVSNEAAEGVVGSILRMFVKNGFQFIMIDQGRFNEGSNLDDVMSHVTVTKTNGVSAITAE